MARSSDRRPLSAHGTDEVHATPRSTRVDWLADGGEMGARIRAFNWAGTPLGPLERWPQSLKITLRILLTSRQPMFVWWGDRLTHLYNDAYRPLLGHRHPQALGQPAPELWRELWHELGPRTAAAMQRSDDADDETLLLLPGWDGSADEIYYLFAANVIPDDQGGPGGLLCANSDDTPRARLLEWEQATRREAERQREYQ
jgi:PAS domain-containing protein